MGWNELSDPDMRTANFEFSCDVYREGVYTVTHMHIACMHKRISQQVRNLHIKKLKYYLLKSKHSTKGATFPKK